jgi:integrase
MRKPKKAKDYLYRKPGYVYFRHPKTRALTRLPAEEKSSDFIEQHKALKAALRAELKAAAKVRDPNVRTKRNRDTGTVLFPAPTLGFFIEKFLASEKFAAYAEGTRYNYRKHLDLLKARLGSGKLIDLDQEAVEIFTAHIASEHGNSAADDQIAMISNLWQFAAKKFPAEFKRNGRMNPTYRIERHYKHDGEGHLVWPDDVIEAFDTECPWHLKFIRLGLHYTGQRGGDVVKMKWTDFDGDRIYVVQEKTGKKLWLNCPKPLLEVLRREQRKTNREYIFHHAYDAPYANAQTLSHAIRNRLEALGINRPNEPDVKGYTMHGLRKNAGMELAEAGAEVMEIMAVLGHKTPKMAMYYCEQARQARMNENAVAKWDAALEKRAVKKRKVMHVVG